PLVGSDGEETTDTPWSRCIRLRLPWLVVNLGTAFVATLILLIFKGTVNKATVLFVFAPAIAHQAGVPGTQTSPIMVRSLAVGEPRKTIAKLIGREVVTG